MTSLADPTFLESSRGLKKKSRTRLALLQAALQVLSEQGESFSLTEVASRAGTSHGTFYNYFKDRDELMAALVPYWVEAFAIRSAEEVTHPDLAVRFATISARALRTATEAPELVRVALRIEAVQRALVVEGPLSYLQSNLIAGYKAGRFIGAPDDGTLDVLLGALLIAARRNVDGDANDGYSISVIQRLLMSLGIDHAEAKTIASNAVSSL